MNRTQLEHVIRSAAAITGETDFVVIGSQAILGSIAAPPAELTASMEADLFPRHAPEVADLVDGSIGEASPFHQTFGYHAHGVGPETAVLPAGWEARLVGYRTDSTGGATAWCLEPHDLAISKLVAGREKDNAFVSAMLRHRLVEPAILGERLAQTALADADRVRADARLRRLLQSE